MLLGRLGVCAENMKLSDTPRTSTADSHSKNLHDCGRSLKVQVSKVLPYPGALNSRARTLPERNAENMFVACCMCMYVVMYKIVIV